MTRVLIVALTITVMPGMLQFTNRVYDYVETHRRSRRRSSNRSVRTPKSSRSRLIRWPPLSGRRGRAQGRRHFHAGGR
jgi:hypothetical protein